MDVRETEALVQRLLENPHDREALEYAHRAGAHDPRAYATVLEKVGTASPDPAYASYWLTEAANVWQTSLGDAHRTARLLMMALEKDPTYDLAAERLAQLYRDNGEKKALVALLERRVASLEPMAAHSTEMRLHVASMQEELGRLWAEPPLSKPKKALERYRRAIELDPQALTAIYAARELCKQEQQWKDALPLFEAERALISDTARKVALYRDEAAVRELASDPAGATAALRKARALEPNDPALIQELGASILERIKQGKDVGEDERSEGASAFVLLAETYDGEHGLAYACAALDIDAGHDRAMQLAAHWAEPLGRSAELLPRWAAYRQANPGGALVGEAHQHASQPAPLVVPESLELEEIGNDSDLLVSDDIPGLLRAASAAAAKGNRVEALAMFKDVLALDATQPEALSWVEDHHRQRRQYAELREVLTQAARAPGSSSEAKKQRYREIAGLCETHLRDLDGAIFAYRQICQLDRADELARDQLRRLLERAGRWDDLAAALEQEAMGAPDVETRILLEKRLSQVHEGKRGDVVAAGEAWARIAGLLADDDSAISTAVALFTKGERLDLAADVIAENVSAIEDEALRAALLERLGSLREQLGELSAAGDAFVAAGKLRKHGDCWRAAERCFIAAERWIDAAQAAGERARLTEGRARAALLAREAELLVRGGDDARATESWERALELDPANEDYAREVESRYEADGRASDLVNLYLRRAGQLDDKASRVALRKRAASLQVAKLDDRDAARETLLAVLEDGDDAEALVSLVEYAEQRGDFDEAIALLRRFAAAQVAKEAKVDLALREAALLSDGLGDLDAAVERYEHILAELDPESLVALEKLARLYEKRADDASLAATLERMLTFAGDDEARIQVARRLADLYEGPLDDTRRASAALETVHRLDPEDFDAIGRLAALSEKAGDWKRVAELLALLIEVEGDDEELSKLSRKLSHVLADELREGEAALGALEGPANDGDAACREAYVALGDKLGRPAAVAAKLLDWHLVASSSEARTKALEGAFERFVEAGQDADAVKVAMHLVRGAQSPELATKLEEVAIRAKDLDALAVAHEMMSRSLSGELRALELVRQAEVLARAGVERSEALRHGEAGLVSIAPGEAEPLLVRLATLAENDEQVVDLYERQIGRSKQPADRLRALARAAQVAAERGAGERARSFFELALSGNVPEEAISDLEATARMSDEARGDGALLRILAEALAGGGQGLRDGGRTRSALLRRAATIAERDLNDVERAFEWLSDALIAHVEPATLDALEELATRIGEPARAAAAIERALGEVFDGPLVRQLLARRVALRKGVLDDKKGAADDLKRLHDLVPADTAIVDELVTLLTELGDHRGMVQLLEDQILRGRDPHARAELARKVARLWEEQLDEPREAADAWRRVLRMKPGDTEAQEGLDRAKAAMLQRQPQDGGSRPSLPPRASVAPLRRSAPPPRSSTRPSAPPPSVRPPPMSPPALPDLAAEVSALLIEDVEPIEEVSESRASVRPPPMPSAPPPLPAGLAHSGPPALPDAEPADEVMLVDDAELLDG